MKMLKRFSVLVLVSLLLTSCVEYNVKVKVNPDGSGTVKETVLMGKAMVSMLNALAAWGEDTEKIEFYNEDDLIKQARSMGKGVKFVKGEKLSKKGREGYEAVFKFDDITELRIDQEPNSKLPSEMNGEMSDDDPITFGFTKGNYSTLTINMPGEFEPEDFDMGYEEEEETEEFEELKDMLKDLRILIEVEVNGDINSTNATFTDGSTVTLMQFDMGEILDDPTKFEYLKNKKPQTKEEVKELIEEIPGLKVELENKVTVKFK